MAQITIDIPDAMSQDILDAVHGAYKDKFKAKAESLTKVQFAQFIVKGILRQIYSGQKKIVAEQSAGSEAATKANTEFPED